MVEVEFLLAIFFFFDSDCSNCEILVCLIHILCLHKYSDSHYILPISVFDF